MLTGVTLVAADVQSSNAAQAVILVDSTLDNLTADDDKCTLREAIMNANSDSDTTLGDCDPGSGSDTITVPAGTYTLSITGAGEDGNSSGDIDITDHLTLNGDGSISTTIDANQLDRVFHIHANTVVHINDLAITGGLVTDDDDDGGGLLNSNGSLTLTNSLISHNVVSGAGARGGGGVASIASTGATSTSIVSTEIYSNTSYSTAGDGGTSGGGVYASSMADLTAQLTISNSIIHNNLAKTSGGGVYGIYRGSGTGQMSVTIERSEIDSNITKENGGGVRLSLELGNIDQLKARIIDSTLSNNIAEGFQSSGGVGGGMYTDGETLFLRSTAYGNRAIKNAPDSLGSGGGIGNLGLLEVINSTISDNHAEGIRESTISVVGIGGGIASVSFRSTATTIITNSTLADNTATENGGGIATVTVPSQGTGTATTTFENTIVADNSAVSDANCFNDLGVQISNGNNLEDGDTCDFTQIDDQINTNPLLGPLQDNGGDTLTHALLTGSPAIDAVKDALCPATDQRGSPRPEDGEGDGTAICDIGSYEQIGFDQHVYLPVILSTD
jgi:CSLREA domain-containing protein